MTPEHPITPPEELVWTLRNEAPRAIHAAAITREQYLIAAAYRAGADYELEEILLYPGEEPEDHRYFDNVPAANIRAWRRPKPPSLAEEALEACERSAFGIPGDRDTIRRALERLQELEEGNE